jgi:methyltransferase (TIGR00027 family)
MKRNQVSMTAQGIALARALEFERPPAERICNDPLARKFISTWFYLLGRLFAGYGERKGPGVIGFLVARCRYVDDCLQAALADGIRQVVILGAGSDSRAYRIEALAAARVIEVDQPATQAVKIDKVRELFGRLPDHVTYVPIDFNAEDLRKLSAAGYDSNQRTLFIWEGVVHYLSAQAVDQTLAFVAGQSAPGSRIVFDYLYLSALQAREKRGEIERMERTRRFTGEGLVFGIEEGKVEEFLRQRGFNNIVNVTAADLHATYFTGPNRSRTVAPVYAIAYAEVAGG